MFIEEMKPEYYVGYLWAKEILEKHLELVGRIVIYSSLVDKGEGLEEFLERYPEFDQTKMRLSGMRHNEGKGGVKLLQRHVGEIAEMPAISR